MSLRYKSKGEGIQNIRLVVNLGTELARYNRVILEGESLWGGGKLDSWHFKYDTIGRGRVSQHTYVLSF